MLALAPTSAALFLSGGAAAPAVGGAFSALGAGEALAAVGGAQVRRWRRCAMRGVLWAEMMWDGS
jgi:hypothetical protein